MINANTTNNREIKLTYQHEFITAAAVALESRDTETLENLRLYLAGWLISDYERAALELLIDNMLELVWNLVD